VARHKVVIVGAGIGGLTTALYLHQHGIDCEVYEAAAEIRELGVGLNLFPHAMQRLGELGLEPELRTVGIEPTRFCFFTRLGQFVYSEPAGLHAGYPTPHLSFHRAALQNVLLKAVQDRLGKRSVHTAHRCVGFTQDDRSVTVNFVDTRDAPLPPVKADVLIGCDGIRSVVRRTLHPDEGGVAFAGINLWRGITIGDPVLDGRSAIRVGTIKTGKLVLYPIRELPGGKQLLNWAAEILMDVKKENDWGSKGEIDDFISYFAESKFDWVDIPRLFENAEFILEYPMVDRDPIDRWTSGRVTLLGDAAHPMYPRGGNGAAQAIIDASAIAPLLASHDDPRDALLAYEADRRPKTTKISLANRTEPPDTIIELVEARSQGKRFSRIEDIVSPEELAAISDKYKRIAGYDLASTHERQRRHQG
jgi:2-polyprenyl-6-methoxyphenol hydroxylase-like FAD-dependent oxidoreductase